MVMSTGFVDAGGTADCRAATEESRRGEGVVAFV